MPVAGCHVAPLSVDTSTPATTPPPVSDAVPEIVILPPSPTVDPLVGAVMLEAGAVVSVEAEAVDNPLMRAYGCAPMSAKRLTVACCMALSGVEAGSARPHDHCTVPAPKTNAPLAARYMVRLWVALWLAAVVPP